MATENSIFLPRESFENQREAPSLRVRNNARQQELTAPLRFSSAQPASSGQRKRGASLQQSDGLNVARGILLGVVLGSICWMLLLGTLYLLVR